MAAAWNGNPGIFRRPLGRLLLWCAVWLLPAQAATPDPIDLHHAGWTARDGAPAMVLTMAQTSDGWLWFGGPNGLFRFDGVRFERYADLTLPANSISILSAQPAGDLWIGYRFGGLSRLTQGGLRSYDERDGLPRSVSVWGIEPDADGRVWAATPRGMFHLDGERWHAAEADWGLTRSTYKTLMRDRHGVLWAQGDDGIYTLAPGARRFIRLPRDSGVGVVTEVSDGSVWSWDGQNNRLNRLTAPANGVAPRRWRLHGEVGAVLFDRAGNLWAGRQDGVEYHTARGTAVAGPQQGLTGGAVTALLEDREGNVWVSTANGVDRFRAKRLARIPITEHPGRLPIAADSQGGMWAGRSHLERQEHGNFAASPLWPAAASYWTDQIHCAYLDADGVLWLGGFGGLWRKDGERVSRVALPNGLNAVQFSAIARDRQGRLWISLLLFGIFRQEDNGSWTRMDGVDGLPEAPARALAPGPGGELWLAYPRNRVVRQTGQGWRVYGPADGVQLGAVLSIHAHGEHVWAGGENGLARRHGDRFINVLGNDGQTFSGVNTMLELDNGDLWINAVSGLFRLPAAEIATLLNTPGYRLRYERIDGLDGLEGTAPFLAPTPTLARATDGYLWATTTTGLFRFDPASHAAARPAPPVIIRRIGVAGQMHPAVAGTHMPPGSSALQIDYTAMVLGMPERVRFRYRMEGVDTRWQEAGRRRTAYYNNLDAGSYHFQVQASNEAGEWDNGVSTLDFEIEPTVTQTWWFKCLGVLALLAACWLAYRLRLRRMTAQLTARMQERLDERERIARELHDTLLQSVQGLILHVHAAAMRLPEPEPARDLIEQALQRADDILHEGRDRVRDLRSNDHGDQSLAAALTEAACRAQPPGAMPMRLLVDGTERRLHPGVQEEVLAIAREAIVNAYRHAQATLIETQVLYSARELRLTVRDNGKGIPAEVLNSGEREDHWGMPGIRERAKRLKARLLVRSEPGAGTEWVLTLPGRVAYADQLKPRKSPG
ncbi:hypothetical protein GJ697_00770 [Pseudoduganella sp. FT25W]|uniref:Histidine kinase n=1 Tax=Duganella alba TaxID=2666081 RepID=A0A6L5QB68_9BURK|nr:sensor histidine kinase [Duganella alba]MRX06361.1 hypothetical protein [Duganella alba]MRX14755.1 hypothetical protein [Duganella alba]